MTKKVFTKLLAETMEARNISKEEAELIVVGIMLNHAEKEFIKTNLNKK